MESPKDRTSSTSPPSAKTSLSDVPKDADATFVEELKPVAKKTLSKAMSKPKSRLERQASAPVEVVSPPVPKRINKPYRIRNLLDDTQTTDTLHYKADKYYCDENKCAGSMYMPVREDKRYPGEMRPKPELKKQAAEFLAEYYASINQKDSEAHKARLTQIEKEINETGTYHQFVEELEYGAKVAWRNAPRCIGRIQWKKLKILDGRHVTTAKEMFDIILEHVRYATNGGNLRSTISIFPPRAKGEGDFRLYNSQLVKYAGYKKPDGTIIGDPASVEITEIAQKLGWKSPGTQFDILPMVLQARGGQPEFFEYPMEDILEVDLRHPKYEQFNNLKLKWYAVPAVANMLFDCGGLEYPAAPFNGWYMATEIGARNFTDPNRYNIIKPLANAFGLDTTTNATLWRDKVCVELTYATVHSYNEAGVTISDHHTASETFMKHLKNEEKVRGGCPADWVWIVPPISGSACPVFHQEMLLYHLKPAYEYQPEPWNDFRRKKLDIATLKRKFKAAFLSARFTSGPMKRALAKRHKITILYATETGKSETFAGKLNEMLKLVFNSKVVCMQDYVFANLSTEECLIIITSTFGNGEAPDNGKTFGKKLFNLHQKYSTTGSVSEDDGADPKTRISMFMEQHKTKHILDNVKYAVFALGSRAYPHFCEFGHNVDYSLGNLGADQIVSCGEGDELSGQDESFHEWSQNCFVDTCEAFGLTIDESTRQAVLGVKPEVAWEPGMYKIETSNKAKEEIIDALVKIHKKKLFNTEVISVKNLQSEEADRETDLVKLKNVDAPEMQYNPGDHLAVYPANNSKMVEDLLKRCGNEVDIDEIIEIQKDNGEISKLWAPYDRLPFPTTLRDVFSHFLDITSPPNNQILSMFAEYSESTVDKNNLLNLKDNPSLYSKYKDRFNPTILEVLQQFPSVKCNVTMLMRILPVLKPRYYSISSSNDLCPGEIHATVALVDYSLEGNPHQGVCSSYLHRLEPGNKVPCNIKPAPEFYMPKKAEPVILIGPGTGIAPFRGFWQQRICDMEKDPMKCHDLIMFFGCRNPEHDDIYKEEMEDAKEKGALTEFYTAYSRYPKKPKQYVQDIVKDRAAFICNLIVRNRGHVYVCGDVNMAADVCDTITTMLAKYLRVSEEDADEYVKKMRNTGYYHEDIFGVMRYAKETKRELKKRNRRVSITKWS